MLFCELVKHDVFSRFVVNVIVGALRCEAYSQPYLLHVTEVPKTNHQTIAKVFTEALSVLWPSGILYEKVFLLVTDGAAYMLKAGAHLQTLYPKMIHLTCIAHAFHRVAETIRFQFDLVDQLISTVKKIFLKSPARVQKLKELYPNLPLPPKPIVIRWGTWLEACEYYSDHFSEIKNIIEQLDEDSAAVSKGKRLFRENADDLITQLCSLKQNYVFLKNSITSLEKQGMSLTQSLKIVKETINQMTSVPDTVVRQTLQTILQKNPGLKAVTALSEIDMSVVKQFDQLKDMSPTELACFKYASLVSVDVERSFSIYKNMLADNRRRFTIENLRMHMVICCKKK